MNQCCGGAVTLVTEVFDSEALRDIAGDVALARPVERDAGKMPAAMARVIDRSRALGTPVSVSLRDRWLVEPLWRSERQVVIYGAGHVGRALTQVLAPMPGFARGSGRSTGRDVGFTSTGR